MDHITFTPLRSVVAELSERCDRCGVAAKLAVTMADGGLAFCGHHANRYAEGIVRAAVRIRVLADFPWTGMPAPSTVDTRAQRTSRAYRTVAERRTS